MDGLQIKITINVILINKSVILTVWIVTAVFCCCIRIHIMINVMQWFFAYISHKAAGQHKSNKAVVVAMLVLQCVKGRK